jgi:hypothetical protein
MNRSHRARSAHGKHRARRRPATALATTSNHTIWEDETAMMRNTVRGILGLILAAAATWLANYIVEKVFGPEEGEGQRA